MTARRRCYGMPVYVFAIMHPHTPRIHPSWVQWRTGFWSALDRCHGHTARRRRLLKEGKACSCPKYLLSPASRKPTRLNESEPCQSPILADQRSRLAACVCARLPLWYPAKSHNRDARVYLQTGPPREGAQMHPSSHPPSRGDQHTELKSAPGGGARGGGCTAYASTMAFASLPPAMRCMMDTSSASRRSTSCSCFTPSAWSRSTLNS